MTTDIKTDGLSKPKSAYLYFCAAKRDGIKAENDGISSKQILSKLGEAWSLAKADGTDKEFILLADGAKAEYQKAKDEGAVLKESKKKVKKTVTKKQAEVAEEPKKTKTKKTKTTSKKDTEQEDVVSEQLEVKPKKKLNGYIKYLQANRDDINTNI